jgi:hypothetical protein
MSPGLRALKIGTANGEIGTAEGRCACQIKRPHWRPDASWILRGHIQIFRRHHMEILSYKRGMDFRFGAHAQRKTAFVSRSRVSATPARFQVRGSVPSPRPVDQAQRQQDDGLDLGYEAETEPAFCPSEPSSDAPHATRKRKHTQVTAPESTSARPVRILHRPENRDDSVKRLAPAPCAPIETWRPS